MSIQIAKNPELLSFESKLVCSDALMGAGKWDDIEQANKWQAIRIQEKSVRGTISNRDERGDIEHNDHAKFIKDISNPNIQTVDNAALPFGCDTLKVSFTLRVLGNLAKPSACNMPDYQKKLAYIIDGYIEEHAFKKLAERYAMNIANGRFLWRNRVCAESVQTNVKVNGEVLKFDAYEIGMHRFELPEKTDAAEKVNKLAQLIQDGLLDTTGESFSFVEVDAYAKLGNGQTVYPSQEMVLEKANKGGKTKYLYQVNDGTLENTIAAMHSPEGRERFANY